VSLHGERGQRVKHPLPDVTNFGQKG
jgi:hypothetical protein